MTSTTVPAAQVREFAFDVTLRLTAHVTASSPDGARRALPAWVESLSADQHGSVRVIQSELEAARAIELVRDGQRRAPEPRVWSPPAAPRCAVASAWVRIAEICLPQDERTAETTRLIAQVAGIEDGDGHGRQRGVATALAALSFAVFACRTAGQSRFADELSAPGTLELAGARARGILLELALAPGTVQAERTVEAAAQTVEFATSHRFDLAVNAVARAAIAARDTVKEHAANAAGYGGLWLHVLRTIAAA